MSVRRPAAVPLPGRVGVSLRRLGVALIGSLLVVGVVGVGAVAADSGGSLAAGTYPTDGSHWDGSAVSVEPGGTYQITVSWLSAEASDSVELDLDCDDSGTLFLARQSVASMPAAVTSSVGLDPDGADSSCALVAYSDGSVTIDVSGWSYTSPVLPSPSAAGLSCTADAPCAVELVAEDRARLDGSRYVEAAGLGLLTVMSSALVLLGVLRR